MSRMVEWIGVASPQTDDRVVYRKLMKQYTQEQLDALDNASAKVTPLIRQVGSTARTLAQRDGFSRDYRFGHRRGTFVQEMTDEDAAYLFSDAYPDGPEFKDLDNPEHADRKPIVPWAYVDKIIYDILREAAAGPIVLVKNGGLFKSSNELIAEYERRFDVERAEHFKKQPPKRA